jgi:hypothetical protein
VNSQHSRGLTVEQLAAQRKIPADYLRERWQLRDTISRCGREPHQCIAIPHTDLAGKLRIQHRHRLTDPDRFYWPPRTKTTAYNIPGVVEHVDQPVLIVEGSSDCWTVDHAASDIVVPLGVPGVQSWKPEYAGILRKRKVYAWCEPESGQKLIDKIASDLPDVWIIRAPADAKDPSDLWMRDPDPARFRARLHELMASAESTRAAADAEREREAGVAFERAKDLLHAPDLLDRIRKAIAATGYAGNTTAPMIVYAAITSRLGDRPANLAVIAPSAAGKNRSVDAPLVLFPTTAYHIIKAGSARALVYGEADYRHRTVIVSEVDSIPEEGPAASAVRALAADNSMEYDVVERDESTGKHAVRHIVKPGPTGLITTATKPVGWQLGTRMLPISVPDSAEQTRQVMHAHARSVNGEQPTFDAEPFVALQRWLELAGERRVYIPYADALAELVPDDQLRMRRDFRQLLTFIEAIALLHRCQRDCDEHGRIVATIGDYRMATELLTDAFTSAATGGVTPAVRETVVAVRTRYEASNEIPVRIATVAQELGLSDNTAYYRVRQALRLQFIANEETRKGHPAKLIPGNRLPDDRLALPEVEVLMATLHPETDSTLQPSRPLGRRDGAARVEVAIPTHLQPSVRAESGASVPGLEGLNAIRGENAAMTAVGPSELRGADSADAAVRTSSNGHWDDPDIAWLPENWRALVRAARDMGVVAGETLVGAEQM